MSEQLEAKGFNELHADALKNLTRDFKSFENIGIRFDVLENLTEWGAVERNIIILKDVSGRIKGNKFQYRLSA